MRSPHTSYRWRRESHRANQVDALITHQLQVERRESHRANQVYALATHQLQVERGERDIEPIKFQVCFIYIAHLKTASTADQSAEQTKT